MMLCKVNIPFTDKETKEQYKAGAEIVLSEKRIAEIRTVNINMISVIGEAGAEKPKATRKKKA